MTNTQAIEQIRTVRVVGRREIAPDVIEFELASLGAALPDWKPGAHIDLRLGDDLIRQYSLVPSRSGNQTWTIAVLIEQNGRGGSKLIAHDLHVGASVKGSGPRNHFPFIEGESYLFIAGGIGITPMIAMCRAAEAAGAQWRLAYLGRSRETMAYLADLEDEFPERVEVYSGVDGERLDVEATVSALDGRTHVYCCGPERLMDAVEDAMSAADLLEYVHLEHFHPKEVAESENEEFTVYAVASDIEFVVPADESILMAADFEGVVVPGDCLEGTCGSCETRVLLGEIEHRDSILSPLQRRNSETMMICVSRAKPGCTRLELDL
jgi:ferredoxin-NADP reductase